MAPGPGPTGRINAALAKAVPADQEYLDKAAERLETIVERAVAPLTSGLSSGGYTKIRTISGVDDATIKEKDRKSRISTAAETEATTLLPAARAALAAVVDLTKAPALGLDPARVQSLLDQLLVEQMKVAVEGKMTESLQELVKKRDEFRTDRITEAKKVAKDIADKVAIDLSKDDQRELRTLLNTRKKNLSTQERAHLVELGVTAKKEGSIGEAMALLETRIPSARATALGLDLGKEKEQAERDLKTPLESAIRNKFRDGYTQLCQDSKKQAEATATLWGRAKWLSPVLLGAATWATIAVIGGTSAVFWVPVGIVAATASFTICRFGQNISKNNHLQ